MNVNDCQYCVLAFACLTVPTEKSQVRSQMRSRVRSHLISGSNFSCDLSKKIYANISREKLTGVLETCICLLL